VKLARGDLNGAAASFADAKARALAMGRNELDALTTTIDQQAVLARAAGSWIDVLARIDEAKRYAEKLGEVDPLLRANRSLFEARALTDVGEVEAGSELLTPHFEDARRRYPFGHVKRMESALLLEAALRRSGEMERAEKVRNQTIPSTPLQLSERYFLNRSTLPGLSQKQYEAFVADMFLASVVRDRSDLRLLNARNDLMRAARDACCGKANRDSLERLSNVSSWIESLLAPRAGAARLLWLDTMDRARLGLTYAQFQVETNSVAAAEKRLGVAEDLLDNDDPANKLDLAEVRLTSGIVKLRQKDFRAAAAQFSKARDVYQAALPATSPRIAVAAFYAALAELRPETTGLSAINSIRQRLADLEGSKLAPALRKRLSDWVQANSAAPNWATLPVVSP
jgi:hypothetical protein